MRGFPKLLASRESWTCKAATGCACLLCLPWGGEWELGTQHEHTSPPPRPSGLMPSFYTPSQTTGTPEATPRRKRGGEEERVECPGRDCRWGEGAQYLPSR